MDILTYTRKAVLTPLLGIHSTAYTAGLETTFDLFVSRRRDLLLLEEFQIFFRENRHLLVDTVVYVHVHAGVVEGDHLVFSLPDCSRLIVVLDGFSSWKKLRISVNGVKRLLLHQVSLLEGLIDAHSLGLEELITPICSQDTIFSNSYMHSIHDDIRIIHKKMIDQYVYQHMNDMATAFARWGEWPFFA